MAGGGPNQGGFRYFSSIHRNTKAATRFFKKLLKGLEYVPRVIITDKLSSYGAAKKDLLPRVEHRQHKRLYNRAENSHQPTRVREKVMRRFKSGGQAQRFLAAQGPIRQHFRPKRHKMNAADYRAKIKEQFAEWSNEPFYRCLKGKSPA